MHTISFQIFFVRPFRIVVDSWKFSILLLYILWGDWSIFMISGSNELLQQELECTLLKPDYHSWWISKMQSDTLKERYAINPVLNLEKMSQKRIECIRLILELSCMNRASGMMRGVGGVRKSIHQSWLANELGLGLGLLCWGFKGVQRFHRCKEARNLHIGSVAFPPGQYASPQLHPCHRLFDQDGNKDSSSATL